MESETTFSRADRLYDQIKAIAVAAMKFERPGHTLQPTAVASEAFIRLSSHRASWESDDKFMQAVVSTVRRVLVDHARTKNRIKRGGEWSRVELTEAAMRGAPVDLLDLDELLTELSRRDLEAAMAMEASVFGGLRDDQIAELLGSDVQSVQRSRRRGRAWLAAQFQPDD